MKSILWKTSMAAAIFLAGCNVDQRIAVEMAQMEQSRPLGSETSLQADVGMDVGALEIQGDTASNLYVLNLEYDKASYQPEISYDPATESLRFRLDSTHKGGIRTERRANRLQLNLTESLPIKLKVNTGVGDARLSLSRLRVNRLDVEGGVGGSKISSYEPSPVACDEIRLRSGVGSLDAVGLGNLNFRRLEFEGGVGSANLDLSGAWKQDAEIRVQVGVGSVNLRVPRDIGVKLTAEKHFLSGLQLDNFHREGSTDDYYSENYTKAKIRVTVEVKTGIGAFRITWI
jgi:hypothetical protein